MPAGSSQSRIVVRSFLGASFDRPSADAVSAISTVSVNDLSELVGPMYTFDGSIRPIGPEAVPVCGGVITAKCPPGDNQAMVRALNEASPGEVLVVDAKGFLHWCLGGYRLLEYAQKHFGLAGIVVNGAYRDVEEISRARFPVYAAGVSPYSGPKQGPGEVNVPVACGGVVIHPGDIISASGEGIALVPRRAAAAVVEAITARKSSADSIGDLVARVASAFDENL